MRVCSFLSTFVLAFQCALVHATVEFKQTPSQETVTALAEVWKVVDKAIADLDKSDPLSNEQVEGPYLALFGQGEMSNVVSIFKKLRNLKDSAYRVTIYLNEDHMKLTPPDSHTAEWMDTDFKDGANNQILPGAPKQQNPADKAATPRLTPGMARKASYAHLGWDATSQGGVDFSNQAHVFIYPEFLKHTSGHDSRTFDEIKQDGFKDATQTFRSLEAIRPISHMLLHELVHVAGGRKPLALNQVPPSAVLITDGTNDNAYGFDEVSTYKYMPDKPADSYAVLAQALYLDIVKGVKCYWSTGLVKADGSAYTPGASNKRDLDFGPYNMTNFINEPDRYHHHHHHDHHNQTGMGQPTPMPTPAPTSASIPISEQSKYAGAFETKNLSRPSGLAGRLWVTV